MKMSIGPTGGWIWRICRYFRRCMQYVGSRIFSEIVLLAIYIANHHHQLQHQHHPQQSLSSSSVLSLSSLVSFNFSLSATHIVCLCCGLWSRVQCLWDFCFSSVPCIAARFLLVFSHCEGNCNNNNNKAKRMQRTQYFCEVYARRT